MNVELFTCPSLIHFGNRFCIGRIFDVSYNDEYVQFHANKLIIIVCRWKYEILTGSELLNDVNNI